eukprot:symbB.v1.2.040161.t1/scaffold7034.1/size13691/1
MLGTHVDDLLWCGIKEMDDIMQKVQQHYNFRLTSSHEFKFCGRIIKQDSTGITINCPSVLDRVKAIYIDPKRRKMRGLDATPSEVSQLRSVVGSLSWYSRVCRPDLSFQVNQLQAVQQRARVEDLVSANRLLHFALETKERGIFYASGVMNFDDAMILSINDASHAASYDINNNGEPMGHRSQSGRILALVRKDFIKTGDEVVHMLQWTSTVIKRVCRSTLQAETLSMQLGSEESEHLRQLLYVMKNLAKSDRSKENLIAAMDGTTVTWCTDCRSLSDHLVNPGISEVAESAAPIESDVEVVEPTKSLKAPVASKAAPKGRKALGADVVEVGDEITKALVGRKTRNQRDPKAWEEEEVKDDDVIPVASGFTAASASGKSPFGSVAEGAGFKGPGVSGLFDVKATPAASSFPLEMGKATGGIWRANLFGSDPGTGLFGAAFGSSGVSNASPSAGSIFGAASGNLFSDNASSAGSLFGSELIQEEKSSKKRKASTAPAAFPPVPAFPPQPLFGTSVEIPDSTDSLGSGSIFGTGASNSSGNIFGAATSSGSIFEGSDAGNLFAGEEPAKSTKPAIKAAPKPKAEVVKVQVPEAIPEVEVQEPEEVTKVTSDKDFWRVQIEAIYRRRNQHKPWASSCSQGERTR